jgi:PAS domain S-box-containing protein
VVQSAHSLRQAVNSAGELNAGLILIDLELALGDAEGWGDAADLAEALPDEHDIATVILTDPDRPGAVQLTKSVSAHGYVPRNADEPTLIAAIDTAVRLHREQMEHAQIEARLRESEESLRRAFDTPSVAMAVSRRSDGTYIEANEGFLNITGYSRDDLIGHSSRELNFLSPAQRRELLAGIERAGYLHNQELTYPTKGGELRTIVFSIRPIVYNGEDCLLATMVDITDRKRAELELKDSEDRFRAIADYTYNWEDWIDADGKLRWVNPAVERVAGYTPGECYRMVDYPMPLIHPDDRDMSRADIHGSLSNRESYQDREFRCLCKDGTVRWMSVSWQPIYDRNGVFAGIRSSMRDITELKESHDFTNHIVHSLVCGLYVYNLPAARNDYITPQYTGITGWNLSEITAMGKGFERLFHRDDLPRVKRHLQTMALAADGDVVEIEYRFRTKDDRWIWCVSRDTAFERDDEGNVVRVMGTFYDITSRKQAELELRQSLAEKDQLMTELNHRVKNNLLLISSLISLKSSAVGSSADLSDIRHQIDAIRIVHEKLGESGGEIAFIEARDYLHDLIATIFTSFLSSPVQIVDRIQDIRIPTKRAVSLGLITNEIATNAIKYGFIEGEPAEFTVELSRDEENRQYVFVLSNSGNPFPDDLTLGNPQTLGLRLISSLTDQLRGTVELHRTPQPRFTIRFPI